MTTRAYLPLTAAELARLVQAGRLEGPRSGHAVTAGLRARWPEGDDEEWEYAAMQAAAVDAWLRLDPGARRRVVLAADVATTGPDPDSDEPSGVRIENDVVIERVAAAHLDTEDLPEGLGAADLEDWQLGWFATQELANLAL